MATAGDEARATHAAGAAPRPRGSRTSFWVRTLQVARDRDGWHRVPRFYTQATAAQLTSDIVNAAHRHPDTVRVKGILPGEVWNARWGHASDAPGSDFVVWIKLEPPADN
jgi:hypothetical protein